MSTSKHGGLYSRNDRDGGTYDRERAIFPEDLYAWLAETQEPAYEKALKAAGSQAKFLASDPGVSRMSASYAVK